MIIITLRFCAVKEERVCSAALMISRSNVVTWNSLKTNSQIHHTVGLRIWGTVVMVPVVTARVTCPTPFPCLYLFINFHIADLIRTFLDLSQKHHLTGLINCRQIPEISWLHVRFLRGRYFEAQWCLYVSANGLSLFELIPHGLLGIKPSNKWHVQMHCSVYSNYHWRRCIWNYHLLHGSHFVQASMC